MFDYFPLPTAPPVLDKSPSSSKSASDKGATGSLKCSATGTPEVRFAWSRRGTVIAGEGVDTDEEEGGKYEVRDSPLDRSVNINVQRYSSNHSQCLVEAMWSSCEAIVVFGQ